MQIYKSTNNAFTLIRKPCHREHAFTLIEMLVVISLIGILAALGLASFTSAQKQARDSVRKSDLKQYQTSMEVYGNLTGGLYPSRTTAVVASTTLCADLNIKLEPDIACSEDSKYASDNTFVYRYISDGTSGTASASKYVIWAKLESKTPVTYIVNCSNGKNGTTTTAPMSSDCPTLTQQ